MKSKFVVILAIVALVGFMISLDYGDVWAEGQQAPPAGFNEAKHIIPVEFSDSLDRSAPPPGGGPLVLDAEQVLYTEPPDLIVGPPIPWDTYDFDGSDNPSGYQVDALANGGDALFDELIANRATLLVSFRGDPAGNAVYYHLPVHTPPPRVKWTQHVGPRLYAPVSPPDPPPLFNVDGLEVWGPLDSNDADFFSRIGDPGGFSVYYWFPPAGPVQGYIPRAVIAAAIGLPEDSVDLDGLMVFEAGGIGGDKVWGTGDRIIFSIRAAGGFDGGEIWVLPFGGAAAPLVHGGHTYNTAFGVGADYGVGTEDIDGIEAYPYNYSTQTPTLTQWGLFILVALLIGSTLFIILRKRKAAVPA